MFYNTGIATYIWVLTNNKPTHRRGKVQLIDASEIYHKLRKNLGDKNKKLEDSDIEQIFSIYTDFAETKQSKIFDTTEFGYRSVTVNWTDDDGKKQKDTEQIPLSDDVDDYFKREVLPHLPNATMDRKKDKIGYEIPFNRYFYEYTPPRSLDEIDDDLQTVTKDILQLLNEVTD